MSEKQPSSQEQDNVLFGLSATGSFANSLSALGANWGWFVGIGVILFILGLVGSVYTLAFTIASVLFVGYLMLIGGILYLVQAWRIKGWGGFLIWTIGGLFYIGAGALVISNPISGAAVLTLLLGWALIAAGIVRLWAWFSNREQGGWGWLAFSGVVTLLAGILIAVRWPADSVWILGFLLAIDLLFQGITLIMVGQGLRKAHRAYTGS